MIDSLILQQGSDWRAQAEVFDEIFFVFLALGTLIGTIVVSYTLWNVYKYRDDGGEPKEDFDAPEVGELPTGQGGPKAKKLFLSFGLSAIVVISLVVYAYGILLYVEDGPDANEDNIEIMVEGYQYGWDYEYPNGHSETGELIVPGPAEYRVVSAGAIQGGPEHRYVDAFKHRLLIPRGACQGIGTAGQQRQGCVLLVLGAAVMTQAQYLWLEGTVAVMRRSRAAMMVPPPPWEWPDAPISEKLTLPP
jgi:hypothetical protein